MRIKYEALMKRAALLILVGAISMTWTGNGETQGICVVERGQDPLDVLNVSVRHNVWIVLDTSGSMAEAFDPNGTGPSKFDVATDVIKEVLDELVDATGDPLVNWGLSWYWVGNNIGAGGSLPGQCDDAFQSQDWLDNVSNQCRGLDPDWIDPTLCAGGAGQISIIQDKLDTLSAPQGTFTPNGISLLQIARSVRADIIDANRLYPDQKNFLLLVTDGDDSCECFDQGLNLGVDEDVPLRFSSTDPNAMFPSGDGFDIRAYNAGLRGNQAFLEMNGGDVNADLGDVFVVGMGLNDDSKRRTNHLAWESSNLQRAALFGDDRVELKNALRNALGDIGTPSATVTLGSPIVGSVPELIPEIPGLLITEPVTGVQRAAVADDIIGDTSDPTDVSDAREARRIRALLDNNVLFTTSVETEGFRGHLKATNIYKVDEFDTDTETRPFDDRDDVDKLFWDAGEVLQARDPDDRTILFNLRNDTPGTEPLEFRLEEDGGTLTNSELADLLGVGQGYLSAIDGQGALTPADAARMVVQVIRGYRLSIHPDTQTFYQPGCDPGNPATCDLNFSKVDENGDDTWKLYDPTNVAPAVVQNPPRSADLNPPQFHSDEYGYTFPDGFYWDNLNRQTAVYLGTNGGVMHAFRGDNGAELYAYIPADVLGDWVADEVPGSRTTLKDLVPLIVADNNGIENHQFFIAVSATVSDVFLNSDSAWHTALGFGRGRGGKFLTAMDISNVGDWDGNPGNIDDRILVGGTRMPKLLFNVGNREGVTDLDGQGGTYDGLGETWSVPVIANVEAPSPLDDQAVMFAGAGYGCPTSGTNEGQFLYVLKMEDGSVYERFATAADDPTAAIPYNGLVARPETYNPLRDDPAQINYDRTTRVYIGDLQGAVYKLDCFNPDTSQWSFEKLYQFENDQPITAAVALKKELSAPIVHVYVGTGGDERADASTTLFQFAVIRDTDVEGANGQGTLEWNYLLEQGERVFVNPVVGRDVVFFAASRREFDFNSCTGSFFSRLFAFLAISDEALGAFDLNTNTAEYDNPLDLGEGKVTGLYFSEDHLYVSKSGRIGAAGETLILGEEEYPVTDPVAPTGTIQVLVRGFRLSPF